MRALRICIVISLLFNLASFAQESDTSKPYYPGVNTYFPLVPGSYWVWQDSFYNEDAYQTALEMTNGEGATAIQKDSVISLKAVETGYSANIKSRLSYKEGQKLKPVYYTYFITKDKLVKKGSITIASIFPRVGDIIINPPDTCIFTHYIEQESTCIVAEVKRDYRKLFKKGVGKIGYANLDFSRSTSNLIEYRIGNGPIVKKHWLMEAPEKK
jgi:hypothetical protein